MIFVILGVTFLCILNIGFVFAIVRYIFWPDARDGIDIVESKIILVLFSLACLAIVCFTTGKKFVQESSLLYELSKHGVVTQGIVVKEAEGKGSSTIIKFVTEFGEKRTFETSFSGYDKGSEVPIWYLVNDPSKVTIKDVVHGGGQLCIMFLFSTIWIVLIVLMWVAYYYRPRRAKPLAKRKFNLKKSFKKYKRKLFR